MGLRGNGMGKEDCRHKELQMLESSETQNADVKNAKNVICRSLIGMIASEFQWQAAVILTFCIL